MNAERVALVTGAARGIGRAVAERLVRDGWRVVAADADPGEVSPGLRMVGVDVSAEPQVRALVESIAREDGRLDALVSNAGIMIRKPLRALSLADWSRVI